MKYFSGHARNTGQTKAASPHSNQGDSDQMNQIHIMNHGAQTDIRHIKLI